MARKIVSFNEQFEELESNPQEAFREYRKKSRILRDVYEAECYNTIVSSAMARSILNSVPHDKYNRSEVFGKCKTIAKNAIASGAIAELENVEYLQPFVAEAKRVAELEAYKAIPEWDSSTKNKRSEVMYAAFELEESTGDLLEDIKIEGMFELESVFAKKMGEIIEARWLPATSELEDAVNEIITIQTERGLLDMEHAEDLGGGMNILEFENFYKENIEKELETLSAKAEVDLEEYSVQLNNIVTQARTAVDTWGGEAPYITVELEGYLNPVLTAAQGLLEKNPTMGASAVRNLEKFLKGEFNGVEMESAVHSELEGLIERYTENDDMEHLEAELKNFKSELEAFDIHAEVESVGLGEIKQITSTIAAGERILNETRYVDVEGVKSLVDDIAYGVNRLDTFKRGIRSNTVERSAKALIDRVTGIEADMESVGSRIASSIPAAKVTSLITAKVNDVCSLIGARIEKIDKNVAKNKGLNAAKLRLEDSISRLDSVTGVISAVGKKHHVEGKLMRTLTNKIRTVRDDAGRSLTKVNARIKKSFQLAQEMSGTDTVMESYQRSIDLITAGERHVDMSRLIKRQAEELDNETLELESVQEEMFQNASIQNAGMLLSRCFGLIDSYRM
jgi:hypothetical protein